MTNFAHLSLPILFQNSKSSLKKIIQVTQAIKKLCGRYLGAVSDKTESQEGMSKYTISVCNFHNIDFLSLSFK